jgi:hypothetical protein
MSDVPQHAAETVTAIATKASTTAYTAGGGGTFLGLLAQVDWLAVTGAITMVGTFLVNWYYKHKSFKLEKERKGSK